jgi:hypothetical protein
VNRYTSRMLAALVAALVVGLTLPAVVELVNPAPTAWKFRPGTKVCDVQVVEGELEHTCVQLRPRSD